MKSKILNKIFDLAGDEQAIVLRRNKVIVIYHAQAFLIVRILSDRRNL